MQKINHIRQIFCGDADQHQRIISEVTSDLLEREASPYCRSSINR